MFECQREGTRSQDQNSLQGGKTPVRVLEHSRLLVDVGHLAASLLRVWLQDVGLLLALVLGGSLILGGDLVLAAGGLSFTFALVDLQYICQRRAYIKSV